MRTPVGQVHPITMHGAPVLHRPCAPVVTFDAGLRQLIADMFASMYAAEGVGLAANQIGVDAQVFVFDCPDETGDHQVGHVVNPVVAASLGAFQTATEPEGCLSVPGVSAPLTRPARATVVGVDGDGTPIRVAGTGLLARCLLHEADHLGGTVYLDRLPDARRREVLETAELTGA